ncbi:hypothetical protein GLOIN_2v1885757 [Rhizophagus irregularis DAOM 181602=DAOM 197198]|nr:hypothetical protein GLOIN_2v1885757 [Rhizophagus irregularis DAOM 181602=DAOM 197198]
MKRSGKKSVEKSRQESHKQTSSQEFVTSGSGSIKTQKQASKQESAASSSGSTKTQKQVSKQESAASGSGSIKTQKQTLKQESAASGSGSTKTQKQTSKQKSAASGSGSTKTQKQTSKQKSAASGSGSTKTQKQTSKQESAASGSGSIKTQKQTSKQQSAASGTGSIKTQKQTSIPEASEDNGPFRLVVPSSLYSQQSRMVPPIRNVTVHRELTPITRTAEPYRSNVHRELTPITRTTEPYRSNVRIAEPYRSNVRTAEPYRRELTPIIREPYSSNWTRDVNETQENDGLRHRHSSDLQDIEFEEDQRPTKRRKGKNLVRDFEDEMEVDEEEARAEMKTILKTFPIELELKYDEKFTSESNDEILRQVIPRLIEAMKPRYTPRYRQVKSWLSALHKHRRVRLLYKQRGTLDKVNRRLHRNNRLNENYDRKELLNVLSDNRYHSPEYSELDEEQPDGKRHINVYNPSWKSEELIDLLRNVLDQHAFSLQSAQLIRTRNYDDEIYNIVSRHPRGAPNWTYVEQNTPADTDFSEPETPIQTMENLIMAEDAEVSAEMHEIVVIEDSEPTGMEELEPTEMEELEPTGVEESEPMGVEESPETEDETDKWYKFVL